MKKIPKSVFRKFETIHLQNISPTKCQNREFTYSSSNPIIRWLFGAQLKPILKNMEHRYFDRVLDLGCGEGALLYELAGHFEHFEGIDISIQAAGLLMKHVAIKNVALHEGDFLTYDFTNQKFDQIIATNVLEHIRDLEGSLKKISQLLAPHGIFYVVLPSENIFYRIGRRIFGFTQTEHQPHVHNLLVLEKALQEYFIIEVRKYLPFDLFGCLSAFVFYKLCHKSRSGHKKLCQNYPMKSMPKVIAVAPVYNESGKIGKLAAKFSKNKIVSLFLAVDDGSTDGSPEVAEKNGAKVIRLQKSGAGAAIRTGVAYGLKNNFDIIVVLAGNGKDDPAQIPRLVRPIVEEGYDYVQGSRFLKGGSYEKTPPMRLFLTKAFTVFWRYVTGFTVTDASNGFRAYRLRLFDDPRLNIWQHWLNGYEYEYYLHYLVHKLGFRTLEVPVSKTYPSERRNYSKITPIIDWWKMVRPLIYLKLKIKQ